MHFRLILQRKVLTHWSVCVCAKNCVSTGNWNESSANDSQITSCQLTFRLQYGLGEHLNVLKVAGSKVEVNGFAWILTTYTRFFVGAPSLCRFLMNHLRMIYGSECLWYLYWGSFIVARHWKMCKTKFPLEMWEVRECVLWVRVGNDFADLS